MPCLNRASDGPSLTLYPLALPAPGLPWHAPARCKGDFMSRDHELDGRVALVTGASRNIGRAIAMDLASAGAAVVVNARASGEAAAAVVREIEARGGKALVALG